MRETHDYKSLPLMVRPNSAWQSAAMRIARTMTMAKGVTLRVYELADGKGVAAVIPSVAGDVDVRFEVKREGRMITVSGGEPPNDGSFCWWASKRLRPLKVA